MADATIRQDFLDGVEEIFSTLFNEAKEPEDGIQFFAFKGGSSSIYQESKFKTYSPPITLVSSVSELEQDGKTDVEAQKRHSVFKVPLKQLLSKGVIETDMTKDVVAELKKGLIKYKDVLYEIDLIQGKIFIENTYMLWEFRCTEIFDPDSIQIEIEEEPETLNLTINEEEQS